MKIENRKTKVFQNFYEIYENVIIFLKNYFFQKKNKELVSKFLKIDLIYFKKFQRRVLFGNLNIFPNQTVVA